MIFTGKQATTDKERKNWFLRPQIKRIKRIMKQPTFLTRQDMERIAEQDIDPALLSSDEIARQIEENDIHISVTINK